MDYIGNKEYAIELAKELAGISNGDVSEYEEEASFFEQMTKDYLAYSSFYIGKGIGAMLFSVESSPVDIRV